MNKQNNMQYCHIACCGKAEPAAHACMGSNKVLGKTKLTCRDINMLQLNKVLGDLIFICIKCCKINENKYKKLFVSVYINTPFKAVSEHDQ